MLAFDTPCYQLGPQIHRTSGLVRSSMVILTTVRLAQTHEAHGPLPTALGQRAPQTVVCIAHGRRGSHHAQWVSQALSTDCRHARSHQWLASDGYLYDSGCEFTVELVWPRRPWLDYEASCIIRGLENFHLELTASVGGKSSASRHSAFVSVDTTTM